MSTTTEVVVDAEVREVQPYSAPVFPPEIRNLIWKLLIPEPRDIKVIARQKHSMGPNRTEDVTAWSVYMITEVPILFQICKETRHILDDDYPLMFSIPMTNRWIHFNLAKDTLHFVGEKALQSFYYSYREAMYDFPGLDEEFTILKSGLKHVIFEQLRDRSWAEELRYMEHFKGITEFSHALPRRDHWYLADADQPPSTGVWDTITHERCLVGWVGRKADIDLQDSTGNRAMRGCNGATGTFGLPAPSSVVPRAPLFFGDAPMVELERRLPYDPAIVYCGRGFKLKGMSEFDRIWGDVQNEITFPKTKIGEKNVREVVALRDMLAGGGLPGGVFEMDAGNVVAGYIKKLLLK